MSKASKSRKGSDLAPSPRRTWRDRLTVGIVIAALAAAVAFVATDFVRYSRNVPAQHPEWINTKLLLANIPMGALESMATRNVLYRDRLNLQAWHGYNEFLLTRVFKFGAMQFDACIEQDSYLTVLFNKDAHSCSAIRLSRNARYPSVYVSADATGRFLEKTIIPNMLLTDAWHAVKLTWQGDGLQLDIDGVEHGRWRVSPREDQVVGFRSGARAASVDNVVVIDSAGREIIRDNFRNEIHFASLFGSILLTLAVLIGGTFLLARWRKRSLRRTAFGVLLVECVALVTVAIFFAFDFFYWSGRYPFKTFVPLTVHADWSEETTGVETFRATIFERFKSFDRLDLNAYYKSEDITGLLRFLSIQKGPPYRHGAIQIKRSRLPASEFEEISDARDAILKSKALLPESSYRVMVMGTSQTWGEGASTRSDQLVFQIHDFLSERFQDDVELITFNASFRGSDSTELIERYKDRLYLLEPDVVVANLSNNDSYKDPDRFASNLTALITFNERRGIRTVFVLEANSLETNNERLAILDEFHQIMRKISETHEVPCIDLDDYLARKEIYDSGFLWWDYIHFTSYGHKTAAGFVAESIADHVRHRRK